jgi:hypothetical protein
MPIYCVESMATLWVTHQQSPLIFINCQLPSGNHQPAKLAQLFGVLLPTTLVVAEEQCPRSNKKGLGITCYGESGKTRDMDKDSGEQMLACFNYVNKLK